MTPEYVTIRDVAGHFNVSVSTIRNWVRAGTIPADTYIKVGDTYRFSLSRVEDALIHGTNKETNA